MSSWNNNGWIVWILLNEKVKSPLMWLLFHWTGTGIGRGQAIWCGWHCANRLISVPCKKLNIPVCHILHLCLYTYMIGWTRLYYSHLLPMAIYKNVCIILLYSYYEHWTYIFFIILLFYGHWRHFCFSFTIFIGFSLHKMQKAWERQTTISLTHTQYLT